MNTQVYQGKVPEPSPVRQRSASPAPTPHEIRMLLRYDPETGKLFWKFNAQKPFKWNANRAFKETFLSTDSEGYLCGNVCGKRYRAHRIAWLIVHGTAPEEVIHINGIRTDNRLENLRGVTKAKPQTTRQQNNTSGHPGVAFHKTTGKFHAYFYRQGKQRAVGYFNTAQEAAAARQQAIIDLEDKADTSPVGRR